MNHKIRYYKKKKNRKKEKKKEKKETKKITMADTINYKYERVTLCAKENI